jgi:NSS family neurotransmitter:Na+ symporter
MTTLFVGWFLHRKIFDEEFTRGSKGFAKLLQPWYFSVRWIAPVIVVFIILEQTGVIDINSIFSFFTQ